MKKTINVIFILMMVILAACSPDGALTETPAPPTATALQPVAATATATVTPTEIPPTATPTLDYPAEGYGPTNFPTNVNPLTGLEVENPEILERRPVLVKVQNLPRADRPQWGVSQADIVYEYYTELGTTRFAALYYGQDAQQVAPIRSARFFDINLIRGYKAMFIFGSAYEALYSRLVNAEFANRLMLESINTKDVISRYDPNGKNFEMADTSKVNAYAQTRGINNDRQNLDGMFFQAQPPAGGSTADEVFVRFSGAIYNRWDYDAKTGRYLRFSDAGDALGGKPETYEQLIDRANDAPIGVENVVMVYVRHNEIDPRPNVEVLDVSLLGTGPAYVLRDGKLYEATWSRPDDNAVLTLLDADGSPFPFKPGQTWIELMAANTTFKEEDNNSYRFTFVADW